MQVVIREKKLTFQSGVEKGNGIEFAALPRYTAGVESNSNRSNVLSVEKWVFGSISFGSSDLL